MEILKLLFQADTAALDNAGKKLDQVGSKAKTAQKEASGMKQAFSSLAGMDGPIGEAASKIADLRDKAGGALSQVRALGTASLTAAAAFTVVAGAAGVLAAIRFAGVLDDLDDLAAKMGLNATQALLMKQELEDAGLAVGAYERVLNRATKALSDAGKENSEQALALQTLGISLSEVTGPQDLLNQVTELYTQKLAANQLTTDEAAAAQRILGENINEAVIAVKAGAAAQEREARFAEAKVGITKAGVAATREFSSANKDLQFVLSAVGSKLVGEVVPAFTGVINAMVDSYTNGGLVKVAFDAVRVAAQLLMVPIRLLFNVFIQLDAAIQSAGRSIGALLAAMRTWSLEPFKELKREIAEIWATANSRTTSPFQWDSGETETPKAGNAATGTGTGTGEKKTGKKGPRRLTDAEIYTKQQEAAAEFARGQAELDKLTAKYDAEDRKRKQEELELLAKRDLARMASADAAEAAAEAEYQATLRLAQGYVDAVNPVERYREALDALNTMRLMYPQQAEQINQAEQEVRLAMTESMNQSNVAYQAGKMAIGGFGDALMGLATTGKLNFKSFATSLIADIAQMIIQLKVIKPLMASLGGMFGGGAAASADGNVFGASGMLKSANGNVFDGPVLHGFKGGIGVLGEEEPEAVMPLKRGANGKLGVQVTGGSQGGVSQQIQVNVTVNGGQTNEETGSAVSKALVNTFKTIIRGEMVAQQRHGGLLYRPS